ncbi:MAG: oligopeptide/dipeptide ABC transporter ATP-binding protein [Candidatus Enterosoma sp.]|nr:ATP-binding cassette domain-containing protein [Mollicutes bacterium]MDY5852043.1 oligopeptide/dipeptide ABC transporter ATP-binding protein [Candidatus Enterosoma sp.]
MENEKKQSPVILSVQDLRVSFKTDEGLVHAVRGVSFDLHQGETLCIVGESGSGKSVTSKTIMGILPASAIIESGSVRYEGEDLTKVEESEFHRIRGHKIGRIFQDPLSSLNPIRKVGKQITEARLVNSNHRKERFDKRISVEEAAYKNCKVKRKSKIREAKNKVLASDSSFNDKISTLENALRDKKNELSSLKKDDASYADKLAEYNSLKDETAKQIAAVKAEKKAAHKQLASLIAPARKEANEAYKAEYPSLKAALDEAKKKGKEANQAYKAEADAEHNKNLAPLKEEKKQYLEKSKKDFIEWTKRDKKSRPSLKEKLVSYKAGYDEIASKIGKENEEYKKKFKLTRKEAKQIALKVMAEVGIPQPEVRFNQYPFEFSGGRRQRIVIAIALTANPEILICDEPTTALDVTIQAQILELINRLKAERHRSIIFISHDLGVVANRADRVAVRYAGKIVEVGTANEIFYDPRHPYTWALLSSIPDIDSHEQLEAIPGTPPYLLNPPKGDAFAARNKYAMAIDFVQEPPYFKISETHYASTWLLDKRAPHVEKPKIVSQRIKASLLKAGVKNESELEK